ncbi:triphosphoribosyl-dephospho-CoA synthase MdcB, partial [Enterococcus faecium]
ENQISPGGSADLLSASLFMLKIEEIWAANTYVCPLLLNE